MVKSNEFEMLLEKIEKEKELDRESYLNQGCLTGIIKEIMSVYYFLRKRVGMPYRGLTAEEFRVAKNKLDDMARNELKRKIFIFLPFLNKSRAYKYYLKNRYFHVKRTPFGSWWNEKDICVFPPNIIDLAELLFQERFIKNADGKDLKPKKGSVEEEK